MIRLAVVASTFGVLCMAVSFLTMAFGAGEIA